MENHQFSNAFFGYRENQEIAYFAHKNEFEFISASLKGRFSKNVKCPKI